MVELKVNYILTIFFSLNSIFLNKVSATELERFFPISCKDLNETLNNSLDKIKQDIVQVQVSISKESFYKKCSQKNEYDGWTIVLHRYNGEQDFNCNWTECINGFGYINGEFFIGLKRLYNITSSTRHELLFILEDFENEIRIAKYDYFKIENAYTYYQLYLGDYSGNAGDSFSYHSGNRFSAKDKYLSESEKCVSERRSPGWFLDCSPSNIFGEYLRGTYENINNTRARGMYWKGFHGTNYALKRIVMMIQPVN